MAAGVFAAQANFTIVRPVDNSRVREKVKIQFPKGSIPPGAYVGIFLNGQLIDSLVPPVAGKYQQYILDTKGRGLPDTPAGKPDRLEAKLFVNYNDQPRIVRTSSVDLSIANSASIKVPNGGFKLRYRFQPGTTATYKIIQRAVVSTMTETANKKGGRPAELPIDTETFRMTYSVDNSYGNGDGLVRMQAAPAPGKKYAILTTNPAEGPKKYNDVDMAAIYMRLTSTGKEVFGSIPQYYALEGTSGSGVRTNLFAAFPLPSLPEKSVRPGDSWQTRFQAGKIDLSKLYAQTSVIDSVGPARGEFVGVEWEMGHPCAKIHNSIAQAQQSDADKKLAKTGAAFAGKKQSVEETIWFALDTRQVLKVVRDQTIETKVDNASGGSFTGPSNGSGGGGGYGGPSLGGRSEGDRFTGGDSMRGQGRPGMMGGQRGRPGMGGMQGPGMGGMQGPGMGGRNGADPNANTATYVRVRIQRIFVLEQ